MENQDKNLNLENQGAHSGFKKGISDYNDGGNVNHYLGNDDYEEGNFISDSFTSGPEEKGTEGKVAYGNCVKEEASEVADKDQRLSDDELVDQAGLESFPASDSPGYRTKSSEDQKQHNQ